MSATVSMLKAAYDDNFYDSHNDGALSSAHAIIPILFELIKPQSVIDFGCGRCAWLSVCQNKGVQSVLGLDGPHVDPSKLLIDRTSFRQANFQEPIACPGRFDLAICLEVVEHLPSRAGEALIQSLTEAAPVVLFSAAIPGQGGIHHINERWPSYWRQVFGRFDYERLDPIRRHVWMDNRIQWWYRQNIYLYASAEAISRSHALQQELELARDQPLELAHRDILERDNQVNSGYKELVRTAIALLTRRFWSQKNNSVS